jgi:GxxExxY protein
LPHAKAAKAAKEKTSGKMMTEDDISKVILDAAFKVHTVLGPGLLESVYEISLAHEVRKKGLPVARQVPIPIIYDGIKFEEGFRADLVVGDLVIVELKAVELLTKMHSKQLLTQLRLSNKRLGLLLNFSAMRLKEGLVRVVNGLPSTHDEPVTL